MSTVLPAQTLVSQTSLPPDTNAIKQRHIAALDGVRGLAVVIVFIFHYGGGTHSSLRVMQLIGFVNKGGWAGVLLFFVLSGFLITGILWDSFEDPDWWSKFFARRSLRIFPLYFLALLLTLLAAIPGGTLAAAASHIWVPALFLENYPHFEAISDTIKSPLALFHLWSIAVEEQFYLVWPWLLLLARTRQRAKKLCIATFVLSACFRIASVLFAPDGSWDRSLPGEAGTLAAGAWLALTVRGSEFTVWRKFAVPAAITGLAGFITVGVVAQSFEGSALMRIAGMPSITVFFTALIAMALEPGLVARVLSMGWLRWLGGISYGFYVSHMLFLNYYAMLADRLAGAHVGMRRNLALFLVAAICSTVLAYVSFHLFERQFLRLKRYFVPNRSGVSA